MSSPTATEIRMMQLSAELNAKLWARKIDNQIMKELELVEQKQWPDWRPQKPKHLPANEKGDTVSIRRQPLFMPPSSGSKRS